ncbi:MAG: DUF4249 domain-containing protein [Labilibaculum antarcticum]
MKKSASSSYGKLILALTLIKTIMRRTKITPITLFIITLLFYSCTEKFYLEDDSELAILVVDGKITNQLGPYEVRLFRTINLDKADTLNPEEGASIFIYDGDGNSYQYQEISSGVYETQDSNFQGQVGQSYWIEIQTISGERYESSPETIQPEISIESIYGEESSLLQDNGSSVNAVKIVMDAKDSSNQSSYLRWEYQESWEWRNPFYEPKTDTPSTQCYPYAYSNDVFIFDGSQQGIKEFKHLISSSILQNEVKFNYEYFIRLSLYSVNFDCYEFWKNIQSSIQSNGSLYDVIPFNTTGNICPCNSDLLVLGYFEASSVNSKNASFSTHDFEMEFADFPSECEKFTIKLRSGSPSADTYQILEEYWEDDAHVFIVRFNFCFDCNVKYSPNKPSFWP